MIGRKKYDDIHEMNKQGFNRLQISKKVGVDKRTVDRYLAMPLDDYLGIERKTIEGLAHYRDFILDIIKVCPQVRDTNLLYRLREAFPDFNYKRATFYRYVKRLREETGFVQKEFHRRRGIRNTPEPGFEGQVDFGQYKMPDMYGGVKRVYFFVMALSYSNMRYAYFNHEPFTTATAIMAHEYAFRYFGGRPCQLCYDQDRVFVVNENLGDIILVKEFEDYVRKVGFSVYLCSAYDPSSKGRVEAIVGHIKHTFLDGRIYSGIDALNGQCLEWLDKGGNYTFDHHRNSTAKMLFEKEYPKLIKVKPCVAIEQKVFCVRKDNTQILYKKNKYAIPHEAQRTTDRVRIEEEDGILTLYDAITDKFLCKYNIPETEGNVLCLDESVSHVKTGVEQARRLLGDSDIAIKFMDTLAVTNKRYYPKQCFNLVVMLNYVSRQSMLEAMNHCFTVGRYSIVELIAYLIYRHGKDSVRKFCYDTQLSYCKRRAEKIKEEYHGNPKD